MEHRVQVENAHYRFRYDHHARWNAYWYQLREVLNKKPTSVLEVGVGSGVVKNYLKQENITVTTVDIDASLSPDIVASITKIPLPEKSVDVAVCCQVLEHLPFEEVKIALQELRRIAKSYIIISVPDARRMLLRALVQLPFVGSRSVMYKLETNRKHEFDGQHYWELGKSGVTLSQFKNMLRNSGLHIEKDFIPFETPTKHFFVLKI